MAKKNVKVQCIHCNHMMRSDNLKKHIGSCRPQKCLFCNHLIKKSQMDHHVEKNHPQFEMFINKRYRQWLRNRIDGPECNYHFAIFSPQVQQYNERYHKKYYWTSPDIKGKFVLATAKIAYMKSMSPYSITKPFEKHTKTGTSYLSYDFAKQQWVITNKRKIKNQ